MRLLPSLLGVAALGQAFIIPSNTHDGVYLVTRDAAGNDVHTEISGPSPYMYPRNSTLPGDEHRSLSPRAGRMPGRTRWCGCNFALNKGDRDDAVNKLKSQRGIRQFSSQSVYSISGSVVAFVCKINASHNWASLEDGPEAVDMVMDEIEKFCGRNVPGTVPVYGPDGEIVATIIGVMQWYSGQNFCKAAKGSPRQNCTTASGPPRN
ncbi:DNA mismatch repair protein MSH2 [Purpureocillium lavendulum]|uniref:DNA mismatch repair protein MSH2 n=1 Tax=Purpureocillium lavendulum TaxID=1247861 RepID=A0AB34FRR8_9HYPO|nr:DNA mismatch repair protein MSH2 [Purpureocillium lavendulum]